MSLKYALFKRTEEKRKVKKVRVCLPFLTPPHFSKTNFVCEKILEIKKVYLTCREMFHFLLFLEKSRLN